jgi:hypothetical protein
MTRTKVTLGVLIVLLLTSIVGAEPLRGTSVTGDQSGTAAAATSQQAAVQGTWSGTFRSRRSNIAPFMITLVINPDMRGHLINRSGISSYCLLKDVDLYVTVSGSNATLAGTDEAGNTITFEGTIDKTGRLITLHYVTNGSASGECESDDGTGNLEKK